MKDIWLRHKLPIIIFAYVIIVIAIVYFLVMPLVSKIRSLSYEIQSKLIDEEIEQSKFKNLPKMEADWAEIESKKEVLNVILGSENELSFIESVESMADTTGNKITLKIQDRDGAGNDVSRITRGRSQKDEEKENILEKMTYDKFFLMEISLEGDYPGLVNFLRMLENSRFYVNVIEIDSKKGEEEKDSESSGESDIFTPNRSDRVPDVQKEVKEIIKTNITTAVYTKQ